MKNKDKQYFIPVDGELVEVTEEVYRAYYQPIWNTRYHAQKNGECRCTKAQLWKCDGICPGCPYYAAGKKVSIDTPIGGEDDDLTLGDTLTDEAPSPESIAADRELLQALYAELERLDPDGKRICQLIMAGMSERRYSRTVYLFIFHPRGVFLQKVLGLVRQLRYAQRLKSHVVLAVYIPELTVARHGEPGHLAADHGIRAV